MVVAGVPRSLMAAAEAPAQFRPYISNARPIGALPYERLVLVSSRVNQPLKASTGLVMMRGRAAKVSRGGKGVSGMK